MDEARIRKEQWPHRGEANRLEPECWPLLSPSFRLEPDAPIFAIGSCFARNIELHLSQLGFKIPTLDFFRDHPDLGQQLDYQGLNKYTPPAIYQELAWVRKILDRDDTVRWEDVEPLLYEIGNGKVFDLHRRTTITFGLTPEDAFEQRKAYYQLFRHAFTSNVAVITLGLVECWYDTERGLYVEFSPKLHRKNHPFVFEAMEYPAALDFVQKSVDLINRDARRKILITTSPVPLGRTFTKDDVIVANTYSKSVLRAVAGKIASSNEGVDYFPSFESVMLTKRQDVWTRDLIHIEPAFVGRVMNRVVEVYVGKDNESELRELTLQFIASVKGAQFETARELWSRLGADRNEIKTPDFHIAAAHFLLTQKDPAAAAQFVELALESIKQSPSGWGLHIWCANFAEKAGRPDLAAIHRERAVEAAGMHTRRWRAWLLDLPAELPDRPWLLKQAEARFSDDYDFLLALARFHKQDANFDAMERLYLRALELQPDSAEVLALYGSMLLERGQNEKAKALVSRMVSANTDDVTHAKVFVSSLLNKSEHAAAEPIIDKLIQLNSNDASARYLKAVCKYNTAGPRAALQHVGVAHKLDPNNERIKRLMTRIKREVA